jgi:hypothetical protein
MRGECSSAADASLLCDDLHRLGHHRVMLDAGLLASHDLDVASKVSPLLKATERAPYIRRSRWVEVQGAGFEWDLSAVSLRHTQQALQCCTDPLAQLQQQQLPWRRRQPLVPGGAAGANSSGAEAGSESLRAASGSGSGRGSSFSSSSQMSLQQAADQEQDLRHAQPPQGWQQQQQQQVGLEGELLTADELVQAAGAGRRPGGPLPLRGWDAHSCSSYDVMHTNHTAAFLRQLGVQDA